MKKFISEEELQKCHQVKILFDELYQIRTDMYVTSAEHFGYVILEWYFDGDCDSFDTVRTVHTAKELFDILLDAYINEYVYRYQKIKV